MARTSLNSVSLFFPVRKEGTFWVLFWDTVTSTGLNSVTCLSLAGWAVRLSARANSGLSPTQTVPNGEAWILLKESGLKVVTNLNCPSYLSPLPPCNAVVQPHPLPCGCGFGSFAVYLTERYRL